MRKVIVTGIFGIVIAIITGIISNNYGKNSVNQEILQTVQVNVDSDGVVEAINSKNDIITYNGKLYVLVDALHDLTDGVVSWNFNTNTLVVDHEREIKETQSSKFSTQSNISSEALPPQSSEVSPSKTEKSAVWVDELTYLDFTYPDYLETAPFVESMGEISRKYEKYTSAIVVTATLADTKEKDRNLSFSYKNEGYTTFSFTLYESQMGSYTKKPTSIKILGDGNELKTITGLTGNSKSLDESVDISNYKVITMVLELPDSYQYNKYYFANPKFS